MDTLELSDTEIKLLQVVLETLTVEQLYEIATGIRDVTSMGLGEVTIRVNRDHVRHPLMILVTFSKALSSRE